MHKFAIDFLLINNNISYNVLNLNVNRESEIFFERLLNIVCKANKACQNGRETVLLIYS